MWALRVGGGAEVDDPGSRRLCLVRRHHQLPQVTPSLPLNAAAKRGQRSRAGFTLIEMLTVVALLIIVLGLMVSLAWDVRRQSSERLTKDLLLKLHVLMSQYIEHHKRVPQISPFIETGAPPRESAVVIAPPLPTTRRGRGAGGEGRPRLLP